MVYQGVPAAVPRWPPPPRRRRRGLLITMVSLGVTMVISAVLLVVFLSRDPGDGQNNATGPGSTAPVETSGGPAPDGGDPTVPGWRAYETGSGGIFDVPPSWTVTMETGEKGDRFPKARYKQGACGDADQVRGIAYPDGVEIADPRAAVTEMVRRAVSTGVSKDMPQISQGPVEEIDQGRFYTKATVSLPQAGSCVASTVVVHVVAAESTMGFTMLVVVGDQGVPDAPADDELARIAKSFRYDAR